MVLDSIILAAGWARPVVGITRDALPRTAEFSGCEIEARPADPAHVMMSGVNLFIERTLAVGLGGAVGAIARYWVSGLVARLSGQHSFPWGTLTVNVLGAFVLGCLMGATVAGRIVLHPTLRTFVAIGLLGAFTTFSTFAYETLEAMRAGDMRFALLNIGVSLVVGLSVAWMGIQIGERM